MRIALFGALVVLTVSAVGSRAADAAAIAKMIDQLGDEDSDTRKQAGQKLEALADEALVALRKAGRDHTDVDVRLRALVIAAAIEKKLYHEVRRFEKQHTRQALAVAVSRDGKRCVSSGEDGRAVLWDVERGTALRTFKADGGAWHAAGITPDGKRVLSGRLTIHLWEADTGKLIRTFAHPAHVSRLVVSPDGKQLLVGSWDGTARLWDMETGKEVQVFRGHSAVLGGVVFVPGGKQIITCSHDATLRLWTIKDGKEVRRFTGHTAQIDALSLSSDGKHVLSAGWDKTIRLWEVAPGKEIHCFKGPTEPVVGIAFSPDGKFCVSGSHDKTLRLWDIKARRVVRQFEGHGAAIWKVAFLNDGLHVLSCSADTTVRLWKVRK